MQPLRSTPFLAFVCVLATLLVGCRPDREMPEPVLDDSPEVTPNRTHRNTPTLCSPPLELTLVGPDTTNVGQVLLGNTATHMYFSVTAAPGYTLVETSFYLGECAYMPGAPNGTFNYQMAHPPGVTTHTAMLPITLPQQCNCFNVLMQMNGPNGMFYAWGSEVPNLVGFTFSRYCVQACPQSPPPPPPPTLCQVSATSHRTHTQAQWGSCAGVAASYLQANFAAAFPNGVQVGNPNGRRLRFTSLNALRNALPANGTPKALSSTQTNPSCINNQLAGNMLALALNLGFDAHNAAFGTSPTPLASLVVGSGPFQGFTVQQLFALGNQALGNQGTGGFSFAQINAAVAQVNALFAGQGSSGGGSGGGCGNSSANFALVCP